MSDIRIGQGFDAHRFKKGRKLVIGGVDIPYELGLEGHSDADLLAHAAADAILGALALGDLGEHFPPGDPACKDADSMGLLEQVVEMARSRDYQVAQLDSVLIAQRPRLMPYLRPMRQNLARILGVSPGEVSVKAKTTEGMGFTGRGQGMAALAVVLLKRK